MKKPTDEVPSVRRSGNVFAQLGLPQPAERLYKARLMKVINDGIKRQSLSQTEAAQKAGVDQADISRIAHGQGARYSLERLLAIIGRLGMDVSVMQRHDEHGDIVVEVRELV